MAKDFGSMESWCWASTLVEFAVRFTIIMCSLYLLSSLFTIFVCLLLLVVCPNWVTWRLGYANCKPWCESFSTVSGRNCWPYWWPKYIVSTCDTGRRWLSHVRSKYPVESKTIFRGLDDTSFDVKINMDATSWSKTRLRSINLMLLVIEMLFLHCHSVVISECGPHMPNYSNKLHTLHTLKYIVIDQTNLNFIFCPS